MIVGLDIIRNHVKRTKSLNCTRTLLEISRVLERKRCELLRSVHTRNEDKGGQGRASALPVTLSPQPRFRAATNGERGLFSSPLHKCSLPKPLWEPVSSAFFLGWGMTWPWQSGEIKARLSGWGVNHGAFLSLHLSPLCVALPKATR